MRNFLLLCVHYIPLLMRFNIELLRKRIGRRGGGGRKAGFVGGGGGEMNWSLGVRGNPRAPPYETLACGLPCYFYLFIIILFIEVASTWIH